MDAVKTLPQMTATLREALSTIEAAAAHERDAERDYQRITNRGTFASDEAHQIALRDYRPAVDEARRQHLRVAEEARQHVRTVLAQVATDRLVVTPDEQAAAHRQEPVIRRVVDTAGITQVRDALRLAIVADDKAQMLLFATLLPDRLAKPADEGEAGRPEIGEARAEITRLLSQVRGALRDPSFDPVRTLAGEVAQRAHAVGAAEQGRRQQAELDRQISSGAKVAWPVVDTLRRAS